MPPNLVWQSFGEKLKTVGDVCEMKPLTSHPGVLACEFGDVKAAHTVFLYGDSHAEAISDELSKKFSRLNIKGVKIGLDGCHIVPKIIDTRESPLEKLNCSKKFDLLKDYISSVGSEIIVTSRWSFRLYPVENAITQMPYINNEGGIERESYREYAVNSSGVLDFSAEAKSEALKELISGLLATKARVFLVYPVPEIAWDIASLNWKFWKKNGAVLREISIPYSDFASRNKFVISIFNGFSGQVNFSPIVPADIFCNSFIKNRCVAQFDGVPFYYDDDHLSDAGAKHVVDKIVNELILSYNL